MLPEQLSGRFIEGVDAFVFRRGDEHQTAGGDDRAADGFCACLRHCRAPLARRILPRGTRQANSPVLRLMAFKMPQGGLMPGIAFVVAKLEIACVAIRTVALVFADFGVGKRDGEWQIIRVDVEQAGRRIERGTGPIPSPQESGNRDRAFEARRLKGRAAAEVRNWARTDSRLALPMSVTFVASRNCAAKGGGLTGMGCVARSLLRPGHPRRARLFFDGKERLAGFAIEEEDIARFRHLSDGVDLLSVAA